MNNGMGFGGQGPMFVQQQHRLDPKMQLAQLLASSGAQSQPTNAVGALDKVAQMALSGYMMGDEQRKQDARQKDYQQTMANAMTAGMGIPETADAPGPNPDGSAGYTARARAGDMNALARVLSGNADTAGMGLQMAMSDAAQRKAMEREDVLYGRARSDKKEDQETNFVNQMTLADLQAQRAREMAQLQAGLNAANQAPIMVPDQSSPTGFKYVRPSDAVGMPAFNANAPFGGGGNTAPGAPMLTGEDFLKTLPTGLAEQVKGISEGRLPYPTGMYLRTPQGQALVNALGQFDPSVNASDYASRAATLKDFTSGQSARNVTSLNTVMGHLDALDKAGKELNNGSLTPLNWATNEVLDKTGDPRISRYNLTANAVADELEKAFRGTGGSLEGIRSWKEQVSAAKSPEQQQAIIHQGIELLDSRIQALTDQYNRGMGSHKQPFELLNPKQQAIYNRLKGGGATTETASGGWSASEVK